MKIYVSHPIRGSVGTEGMQDNINAAILIATDIRRAFPSVEFYVPAEHEELVTALGIDEPTILAAYLKILSTCDGMVCLDWDSSKGMDVEREHCALKKIPWKNVWGPNAENSAFYPIAPRKHYIEEIRGLLDDVAIIKSELLD